MIYTVGPYTPVSAGLLTSRIARSQVVASNVIVVLRSLRNRARIASSDERTEGEKALAVTANGSFSLTSARLTTVSPSVQSLALDLALPPLNASPSRRRASTFAASLSVRVKIPSQKVDYTLGPVDVSAHLRPRHGPGPCECAGDQAERAWADPPRRLSLPWPPVAAAADAGGQLSDTRGLPYGTPHRAWTAVARRIRIAVGLPA